MLNSNENNENKTYDFEEINSSLLELNKIKTTTKEKPPENPEDLSATSRVTLFLCGFSYCGLLLLSIVWAIIFSGISETQDYNMALESAVYFSLLAVLLFVCYWNRKYFFNELKNPSKYLGGFLFSFVIIAAEIVVSALMIFIFNPQENGNQEVVNILTSNYPTLMFVISVIVGPLCEELTYRVGLYGAIAKKNETLGFLLSGFIFALAHVSFTTTDVIAEIAAFPVYLTISYLFIYVYKKYGLAGSYVAHAVVNLISFLNILFL